MYETEDLPGLCISEGPEQSAYFVRLERCGLSSAMHSSVVLSADIKDPV